MSYEHNAMPDRELASMINPLLLELEARMVMRGEGGNAAQIAKLRTYVVSKFGVERNLKASDNKTRPMFGGADGSAVKQ